LKDTLDYTTTKNPLNDECDETLTIKVKKFTQFALITNISLQEDQITIDHTSTFTDDSRDSIADFVCSPSSREENNNGTMVAIRRKKVYAKAKTSPKNLSQPLKPESEEKREENEYSQDVKTDIDETTQILLNPKKNRIPKPESEEKREENEDSQDIKTEIDETTQILLNGLYSYYSLFSPETKF
jgi:hypothetical protein